MAVLLGIDLVQRGLSAGALGLALCDRSTRRFDLRIAVGWPYRTDWEAPIPLVVCIALIRRPRTAELAYRSIIYLYKCADIMY